MKHKIDLHGLSHTKAIHEVEHKLIGISMQNKYVVEVITGNSIKMQQKIIDEVLVPLNFFYYIPPMNKGMIVVCDNDFFS
jgi:hypothetical protein